MDPLEPEVLAMSDRVALDNLLAVGIDPHRDTLQVVGIRFPEEILLDQTFDNVPTGYQALWAQSKQLASQHHLRLVVGVEESGNYGYALARYLVRQGCPIKEVNSLMTNRQRDFYGQDKTDRLDALSVAAIVLRAFERLPDVTPIQEATQATKELSRYREQLVKEQTASINQLHGFLANQYPAYKTFFSHVNGMAALAFWRNYPTPSYLEGITTDELAHFLYQKSHHRLGAQASREKAQHILEVSQPTRAASEDMLVKAQAQIIQDLAQRLLQLRGSIQDTEKLMEETIAATGQQLQTFKGVGTALAGILIGETLSTSRFDQNRNRFAKYNGTAPATKGSGKHVRQVENRWCNRHLKNAFHQLSINAARLDPLSKEYYQKLVEKGMRPPEARKRLMRRLSDILFAMMRDMTPYDPAIHRRKRKRKAWQPSDDGSSLALSPLSATEVYHTEAALSSVV